LSPYALICRHLSNRTGASAGADDTLPKIPIRQSLEDRHREKAASDNGPGRCRCCGRRSRHHWAVLCAKKSEPERVDPEPENGFDSGVSLLPKGQRPLLDDLPPFAPRRFQGHSEPGFPFWPRRSDPLYTHPFSARPHSVVARSSGSQSRQLRRHVGVRTDESALFRSHLADTSPRLDFARRSIPPAGAAPRSSAAARTCSPLHTARRRPTVS
jgi:hypothetical protein